MKIAERARLANFYDRLALEMADSGDYVTARYAVAEYKRHSKILEGGDK